MLFISGCKFYAIFVDDFSWYSWIFPLKHKSDVFDCFVKFKSLIENFFTSKIKQIQTDGAGEYTSHKFTTFSLNMEFTIDLPALIHPNKMG